MSSAKERPAFELDATNRNGPRPPLPSAHPKWGKVGVGAAERPVVGRCEMATANYDLNEIKRRMQGAVQVLRQELGGLRTGRASPGMLDPVQVDAYGTHMPL